ncbi:MAG: TylF/MycF/NovP-related O-methyltransferase [Methylophilaceae bacterium]
MKNHLTTAFYCTSPEHHKGFIAGIQQAIQNIAPVGVFAGDNLIAINRNLSFLYDETFLAAFNKSMQSEKEQSLIWRVYVLCWAAKNGLKLDGDFVECACYKGDTARIVCDYLDLASSDKQYFLYDLFEHSEEMNHHAMHDHGETLFQKVQARFVDQKNVHVTKGPVPEILHQIAPEKIAFMHLDLNNASAEIGALEVLFDRIVQGGIIVLDDYGWLVYKEQKDAADAFFEERGYFVLELPTGQGLMVKTRA